MTKQEFIKFMSNLMKEKNFIKKGSNYYFDCGNDVLCVLGMYKSNYDNYYYMEYGFVFKSINPKMPFPKYSELNINCGRIWADGKDAIYYEHVTQEALKQVIHDVVSELVEAEKVENKRFVKYIFLIIFTI